MNTQSKETRGDGNQRRKSIGSGGGSGGGGGSSLAGGKTRRYSIGITSSRKSIEEEGTIVPNYLRASTGSCHDFCKFGKKHEHSKSAVPVKFKPTTIVNKDKFTKTVVPLEKKKLTLKPSTSPEVLTHAEPVKVTKKVVSLPSKKPQVLKQSSSRKGRIAKNELKPVLKQSSSTNGRMAKNELKPLQRSTSLMKSSPVVVTRDASSEQYNVGIKNAGIKPVKKTVTALNELQSSKASFSRAANLTTIKHKGIKQVSPLKDQNRMQKRELKQTVDDEVQTKTLNGVEAEPKVKPETMEFDFIQASMESINDPICNCFESHSGKKIVEEESMIVHPDYESSEILSDKELLEESIIAPVVFNSSELFLDKELLEESLIAPAVVESSQSCSDKEVIEDESIIVPPESESSESFYDDEVLEGDSEYTDDEEDEVSEESETADVNEMETSVHNLNKFPRRGRMVISEDKDDKAVKLRFRRGKILDLQSENNGPRRLKFRKRVIDSNEDGQSIAERSYKNKTLNVQIAISGPGKLKFTKGKVTEGNDDKQRVSRRSFEKKYVEAKQDSNNGPESVVLKHQGEQEKKDAQGLFNNVIEETASKLVESRKSKVKALVGAFETVISLQDGKPTST